MWKVEYLREALEDIKKLAQWQRVQVIKAKSDMYGLIA